MLDLVELQRLGAESGSQLEPLEKTRRLLERLDALRSHPFARTGHWETRKETFKARGESVCDRPR